jgi:hypothetical protein
MDEADFYGKKRLAPHATVRFRTRLILLQGRLGLVIVTTPPRKASRRKLPVRGPRSGMAFASGRAREAQPSAAR